MTDAVKMAKEALRPFKLLAELARRSEPGASEMINVNIIRKCAEALAALEQAGEPVAAKGDFRCHNCKRIVEGLSAAPKRCPECLCRDFSAVAYSERKYAPLPTLQRLGQEFDAGEAVVRMYERNPDVHLTFRAHPPQSCGQAFDGEGEGFAIGDPVEKFTGEAIWHGVVVASYLTSKGKRRYVVEVEPQGFQMIAVPSQLRALSSAKRGEA